MNVKLKRIAPLQAGKILACFYGLLSLIVVPVMFGFMTLAGLASQGAGGHSAFPLMFGMGMGFMIFIPILYATMGFIFGVIAAFVYNLLAGWIGGLQLEFESSAPPAL